MVAGQSSIIGFPNKVLCESKCEIIKRGVLERVYIFDLEKYYNYSSSKLSVSKGEMSYIWGHCIFGLLG
jgi:hypothetical protein